MSSAMEESGAALSARCRALVQADVQGLEDLTSQISVFDTQSIVTFGSEAAGEIAKSSDAVLQSIRSGQGDPSSLLGALADVMEKFDPEELSATEKKGKKSLFSFGKKQASPDQILEKYREMGEDVDRLYIALKQYEAEVRTYNQRLQAMYDANVRVYRNLVRFLLAAERGLEEIQAHLQKMEAALSQTPGNAELQMDRDTVRQAYTLLERRLQDLRVAEIVALQSIPMIQTMQGSNLDLIQKIDSAFLVTLPIFKRSLGQAVARKRQRLQSKAMESLDRRTREALETQHLQRKRNDEAQSEALEQTRKAILAGIEEAQALRRNAGDRRASDAAKLDALQQDLQKRALAPADHRSAG